MSLQSLADLGPIVAYCDHVGEALYAVDRDWRFVAINDTALAFAKVRREDLLGRVYWDVVGHPAGHENVAMLRNAMASPRPTRLHTRSGLHADRFLSGLAIPLRDGLLVTFRDVTEERAAEHSREQRLSESENRLRLALEATELGTWDFDPQAGTLAWDERCRVLFGYPADRAVDFEAFAAAVHPEDRDAVVAAATSALDPRGSGEVAVEHRVAVSGDEEERWLSGRGRALFEGDKAVRLIGTVRDITARKRAEEALRKSESRLRLALDAGRMAVWAVNLRTQAVSSSPELNRMLGYPPDHKLTLEDSRSRYHPGDGERLRAAADAALGQGERYFEFEYRVVVPETGIRWLLLRAEILRDAAGAPAEVIGVVLDITDRKEAEEALRNREAELRSAMTAASLASFEFDNRTGRVKASPRLNEMYGYPADRNLTIADVRARYHPDDVEQIARETQAAGATLQGNFELEFRLLLPGGAVRWVNGRGELIRDGDGQILGSRGVVIDVTDRKRAEERQQLLLNELNHRVKNTLATVQSIASQSLRTAETAEEARGNIESRLLALSRAHDVLTREGWAGADVREVVSRAVEPYQGSRGERIGLRGPPLRVGPQAALALAMALQELATNAVKYGALSNEAGIVDLAWELATEGEERWVKLRWVESGGPPVREPARRGFGTRLIQRSLAADLGGEVGLEFRPEGVACTIHAPLSAL